MTKDQQEALVFATEGYPLLTMGEEAWIGCGQMIRIDVPVLRLDTVSQLAKAGWIRDLGREYVGGGRAYVITDEGALALAECKRPLALADYIWRPEREKD